MVMTEPDFIATTKRIKYKRDRLFVSGGILLLISVVLWLFSMMQHYDVDSLYTMAETNPVAMSFHTDDTAIEGRFDTLGNVVSGYLTYIVPFLVALMLVVGGIAIVRSEASILIIILPIMGVIFSVTIFRNDEPKTLPSAPSARTVVLIPAGEANALLRAITTEYPGAGAIFKDAMEKGVTGNNAVTALQEEMRQGYVFGNARKAMSMSVALAQALVVAAENTSNEDERKDLLDKASRIAALSVRVLRGFDLVEKELAYRLYELAQRLDPSIANEAKPAIELKYQESAKMEGILRTLKGVFLMMSVILIALAGFSNRNLRVIKKLKMEA